ncbi:class I SAM-dependent methyltransferase [Calycomorphotria hydatis]|uniref:Demethylrebeccamycin-D-glucose O-methyltransferase n=1 Tax=Calycomorphotria hydatis TaxID=2528027 RepID=A0A517TF38_9PLAN|nr:class I SAM-dependent methyltransferase [Calycomorphotria hydatis]QDT66978.1 Demethylrebeccamycin-D-glucose O-methyltransferase [Calycomorphotria hydatis]
MIQRIPEPELMDRPEDVVEYDTMDHTEVNRRFVSEFLEAAQHNGTASKLHDGVNPLRLLDLGTGTGQIPILLAREPVFLKPTITDLSESMIRRAKLNIFASGLQANIKLEQADAKELPYEDNSFDAVICNSLFHHVSDLPLVLKEIQRVLADGGVYFIRDLARPGSDEDVEALVEKYAGSESEAAQKLLRDSLKSAYTVEEIAETLTEVGLPADAVKMTSDRHWTIQGNL